MHSLLHAISIGHGPHKVGRNAFRKTMHINEPKKYRLSSYSTVKLSIKNTIYMGSWNTAFLTKNSTHEISGERSRLTYISILILPLPMKGINTVLAVSDCVEHDVPSYAVLKRVQVEFLCGSCWHDTLAQCWVQRFKVKAASPFWCQSAQNETNWRGGNIEIWLFQELCSYETEWLGDTSACEQNSSGLATSVNIRERKIVLSSSNVWTIWRSGYICGRISPDSPIFWKFQPISSTLVHSSTQISILLNMPPLQLASFWAP